MRGEIVENLWRNKIVEKILHTLTGKWNYVICSIEESKNMEVLPIYAL